MFYKKVKNQTADSVVNQAFNFHKFEKLLYLFQDEMKDDTCVNVQDTTSNSSSNNGNDLISNAVCQTYWYRWYICFVFSMLGLLQGAIWNTWGPMDESAKVVFGFSPGMLR